jgi:hypothetical protein
MSIILELRNGDIVIPNKFYNSFLDFDWFISNLINFSDNDKSNTNPIKKYSLWEDKNTVLSLFDSLRFNKLILHNDISIDYFEALCDMWCAPEWLMDEIIKYKDNNKIKNKITLVNNVFKCENCKIGFKLNENTDSSCKYHPIKFDPGWDKYICCGRKTNDEYCKVGYHFVESYTISNIINI